NTLENCQCILCIMCWSVPNLQIVVGHLWDMGNQTLSVHVRQQLAKQSRATDAPMTDNRASQPRSDRVFIFQLRRELRSSEPIPSPSARITIKVSECLIHSQGAEAVQ